MNTSSASNMLQSSLLMLERGMQGLIAEITLEGCVQINI